MTASDDLLAWEFLATDQGANLIVAAAEIDPHDAAALQRLRRRWSQSQVRAALALAEGRRRGRSKFGSVDTMMLDSHGAQQATSELVACHKAARFSTDTTARGIGVVDLCCGIGGDAMALSEIAETTAIDHSSLRCWMAAHNARCTTTCLDVTDHLLDSRAVHCDPARRDERSNRRLFRLKDLQPGPEFLASLAASKVPAAIKLSPACPFDQVPGHDIGEFEVIGQPGGLAQAVLWLGSLARGPGTRRATRLPDGLSLHGHPAPLPPPAQEAVGPVIAVLDPAAERSGLGHLPAAAANLTELAPGLGILTGEDVAAASQNPWLTTFHVLGEMAWRSERVATWLTDRSMGVEVIRTRGKACDPDTAIASMPRTGDHLITLFVLRLGSRRRAIVTRPAAHEGDTPI